MVRGGLGSTLNLELSTYNFLPDIIPSMSLTIQEVEHIARLARLELTDEQKEHYRGQLSTILDHIARLQELDTRDIPPTTSGSLSEMPLRADEARPGLSTDVLLANAPETADDQFKVPPVFE